jgi:alkylated DNA repair dioxygenase AlkB
VDGARKHVIQALNDQRPFFNKIDLRTGGREQIGDGAYILRGRDLTWKGQLLATIDAVSSLSPSRHTVTPDGYTMSASIMNCVEHGAGSLTDADTGTPPDDHATGNPSPSMPRRGRSACDLAAAEADCNRSSSSPMIRCHSFSSERLPKVLSRLFRRRFCGAHR